MTEENGIYEKAQVLDDIMSSNRRLYDDSGLTREALARKHFQLLNAKTTKQIKIKGAVNTERTPSGRISKKKGKPRILATSGLIVETEDGVSYSDGETVIEIDYDDNSTQLKALMDANKMRGDIPAEKKDLAVTGISDVMKEILEEIEGENRGKLPSEDEY